MHEIGGLKPAVLVKIVTILYIVDHSSILWYRLMKHHITIHILLCITHDGFGQIGHLHCTGEEPRELSFS